MESANGVAEMAAIDAIELLGRREVHVADNGAHDFAFPEPTQHLRHTRLFDGLVEGLAADLS